MKPNSSCSNCINLKDGKCIKAVIEKIEDINNTDCSLHEFVQVVSNA